MGDHRANVKIQFEMHGVKRKADFWISYYPDQYSEYKVDKRILEWLTFRYREAMEAYEKKVHNQAKKELAKIEDIKKTALSKLTEEEQKVLGYYWKHNKSYR